MNLDFLEKVPYLCERWSEHVKNDPQRIVLVDGVRTGGISREMMDQRSAQVYAWLKQKGIGREDFVLICLPRGIMPIIAMLGVWKAGAAFTVVEDNYAPDRIEYIKKDCGCKAVIDMKTWEEICSEEPLSGYEKAEPHDAAFAVYTSGTTGFPKGVLHEYGNIKLNQITGGNPDGVRRITEDSRFALIAPLNFIASIKMALSVIYNGFALYIVPYDIVKNPIKLKKFYRGNRITDTFLSPSMIRVIGELGPYLKHIFTGSEPANGIYIDGIDILNTYSMSEGAFNVAKFIIDRPYEVTPVGKPTYDGIKLRLLEDNGQDVLEGEVGELCFENPFMRGYINLPEQTAEALKDGLYHTGDLARRLSDGNIVLLGRKNDMIKINGNRIEPAEIEAMAKRVTGLDWCAVKGFEEPNQSYLCLYYTDDLPMSEEELKAELEKSLPYYMIPAYYIRIEHVPLLPNGKLNRRALPKPQREMYESEYAAPQNEVEKRLCDAFAKVLQLERVGRNDDFYQLGGDSLRSMQVLVEADLDDFSAMDIFKGCTAAKIAEIYLNRMKENDSRTPEEIEAEARRHPQPLMGTQLAMFDWQLSTPKDTMLSVMQLFKLEDVSRTEWLCDVVNKTIRNHPVCSTVYEFNEDCDLQQRYAPELCPVVEIEHVTEEEFEKLRPGLVKMTALLQKPLFTARIFQTEKCSYLFIEIHHSLIDGTGMQVFLANMLRIGLGEEPELDTFYSYLAEKADFRQTDEYWKEMDYFERVYGDVEWSNTLEPDQDSGANLAGMIVWPFGITIEQLEQFEKKTGFSRSNLFDVIVALALGKYNKKTDVLLEWAFHYRVDEQKRSAAGLVVQALPLGLRLQELHSFSDICDTIRRQMADGIANCRCEWLAQRTNVFVDDSALCVYETASIANGGALSKLGLSPVQRFSDMVGGQSAPSRRLTAVVVEGPDGAHPMFQYSKKYYSEERIREFTDVVIEIAKKLLEAENPLELSVAELLE